MQDKVKLHPKTVYMDQETIDTILDMATKRKWKFTLMASVLLQDAIREKNRKKRATEKDHS